MKKAYLLPLFLLAASCQVEPAIDEEKLKPIIAAEQAKSIQQDTAFLTLCYGDSRQQVANKLLKLQKAGKVESYTPSSDDHDLVARAAYKFTTPSALQDFDWTISGSYHNDSLIHVSVSTYNLPSEDGIEKELGYNALCEKYTNVYGQPSDYVPKHSVYIHGTQRIDLERDVSSLRVKYQNTKLEERLSNGISTFVIDSHGNTFDSLYYKSVELPRLKRNPDKI